MQSKRKLVLTSITTSLLLLVVSGAYRADAQGGSSSSGAATAAAEVVEADPPPGPAANTVTTCSGTTQESVIVKTKDTPTTINEGGAFVALADSGISRFVPANDSDTVVVDFTAESHLTGASGVNDRIEVVARLNGVDMAPIGPISFKGDNTSSSNSAKFCKRVAGGTNGTTYTVQIFWRVIDNAPLGAVSGTVDDWANHVEWSN